MKKVLIKVVLLLFVFSLFGTPLFAGGDVAKLKTAIEALNDKLVKANLAGDLETVFSVYSDDVIYMPNYSKMIKGKEAVKMYEKESIAAGTKIQSMKLTTLEVHPSGDLVYEVGTYDMTMDLPGMSQSITDKGKYLTVWQKQSDGSLVIKFEIWNTDMNPWMMGKEME